MGSQAPSPVAKLPGREQLAERVLVVDDNATNRRILEEVLASWGMQATLTDSGKSALEVARRSSNRGTPFDLVLLYAHMPLMDGFTVAGELTSDVATSAVPVVMLCSSNLSDDSQRCRELGVAAYLTKPVKQSELLAAILTVTGHAQSGEWADPSRATHRLSEPHECRSILLVEDGEINQKVAVEMLKRCGHRVTVATNGREALAAVSRSPFDLILMDVHMPEMDGLEATAEIRRREEGTGAHIPIVAMTGNAMKGDLEKCLAAGMDGYLAKPIHLHALAETVERFALSRRERRGALPVSVNAISQHPENCGAAAPQ